MRLHTKVAPFFFPFLQRDVLILKVARFHQKSTFLTLSLTVSHLIFYFLHCVLISKVVHSHRNFYLNKPVSAASMECRFHPRHRCFFSCLIKMAMVFC